MSYKGFLEAILLAAAVIALLGFLASRLFIADSDAIRAAQLEGYKDVKVESLHRVFPNRFGCKTMDAVAFVLSATTAKAVTPKGGAAKKVAALPRMDVTVCCGAWFSGCAVRKETSQ